MYKIYFPLFDHHESRTNEVRLTHEGLLAHPQVTLVDRPELADYLVFCQNRAAIASSGRNFVLMHHRSIDRVNAIISELPPTGT